MKSLITSRAFQMAFAVIVGLALWHFGHTDLAASAMFVGATLPTKSGAVTLLEMAKAMNPDGTIARTINLLSQSNEMLTDMTWKEGNLPTGHRSSILSGLPVPIWRKLYQGVPPSNSTRVQVDDSIGMLEARSEVDKDLATLNGNEAAFRLQEAQTFLEAMNQNMAETIFYGDASVNPERFTGLTPRYSSLGAGNGQNIIDAGGTGSNNTSVWLVVWGDNTISGIYPKGSEAGLIHQDLGELDAFDSLQNRYRAYAERWQWKGGLSLRDWRYVVRIANINVADLVGQTGTQASTAATSLPKLMLRAMARIPFMGMGRAVFYGSRTAKEFMSINLLDRSQNAMGMIPAVNQLGTVSPGNLGNGSLGFFGVPVRTVDRLLSTEARVV
jgi:hypothetical protein